MIDTVVDTAQSAVTGIGKVVAPIVKPVVDIAEQVGGAIEEAAKPIVAPIGQAVGGLVDAGLNVVGNLLGGRK